MTDILDLPFDVTPDPDEFIKAAMEWHFNPETGSPFWLRKAETLDFDPRADVKSHHDLWLFPNVTNELRDVPARDLLPRAYGIGDVLGVFESGGTTGAPKRVLCTKDWMAKLLDWSCANLDLFGCWAAARAALACVGLGRLDEAATLVSRALAGGPALGQHEARWAAAELAVARGEPDALSVVRAASRAAEASHARIYLPRLAELAG